MDRIQVLQNILKAKLLERYLEIGCLTDECFSKIVASFKLGVDPISGGTLRMTSDQFFSIWVGQPFDLVFIDGDHHHDQVVRDIDGAFRNLSDDGVVVMHDCLPPDPNYESPALCGTAWRAFARLRQRPDVEAFCVDADFGVGVAWKAENSSPVILPRSLDELRYDDLASWRDLWMRPVPASEFESLLKKMGSP